MADPTAKIESEFSETKDKFSGRTKQAVGSLTDDDRLKREGEREENKGKVKEVVDKGLDKLEDGIDSVRKRIS